MAGQRIVAELGRPETPEETAARKAASSQRYRSSQTFRNLIAALLVCVALVAVVILGVPRGTPAEQPPVDVTAQAAQASEAVGHEVIVPDPPSTWRVNSARIEGGAWRVVYGPPTGFIRVSQSFDAPENWVSTQLGGYAPTGNVSIDGIDWDVYDLASPVDNVSYALATEAGTDTIMIYGSTTAEVAAQAATGLGEQIRDLREELG